MKRKVLSLALVLVMMISLIPSLELQATASPSSSDMDALSALGIDTSKSPDGFNANSTDNPYGKNTVELTPVSELYTVGLETGVSYDSSYDTTSTLQDGSKTDFAHNNSTDNTLQYKLYGNNKWDKTTVSAIMGSGDSSPVKSGATDASGTTTADGKYTLVSTGTVSDTASSNLPAEGYLNDAAAASTDLGNGFKFALSSVAAGNFDGNESGLAAQTAMVYTSDYSTNGGLYLRFGNATSGTYGSSKKDLLGTDKKIGNPDLTYEGKLVEDFANAPYQLQNYLQVATGDWNGDGLDEVAVYIPELGNSRIVVYALQLTSADDAAKAYLDPTKWAVAWTYYLHEGDVVSNMVSLVSGDVNLDGTDDLAATWGYYYGPTQNIGSTAAVMFGAKGTAMLTKSQQFSLTYGVSNIVRASFAFGDMAGSDSDVLILCGQSDADLKAENTQTRYVALYDWNGKSFTSTISQNFNLFAKNDNKNVWAAMTRASDKFYSLPLCVANSAVISQGINTKGDLLYFDSLIIKYGDKGLEIKESWDNTSAMQQNTSSCVDYVEYGAVTGDFTGQTGAAALVTMTQTLSSTSTGIANYTVNGTRTVPKYSWAFYYKNWLHKLFKHKTWYRYQDGTQVVAANTDISVDYEQLVMGKACMVTVDPAASYNSRIQTDFSHSICLANTDNDSSYMNYSGKHYYTYTDPQVLSVLASPPYFSDLLGRDDLSGNYGESTTTYSKTSASGSAITATATIKIGAYVSYEQDFKVFGVTVASVEAEAQVTAGFTYDWEKESTLEQTVTYSATAGEDMVSFYSIPMEIYEYTSYVADGKGGYTKVLTSVNIPHEASVRLLSLDEYEYIQKDYSVLPPIADSVLTHDVGDPSTYPTSTSGYNVVAQYTGDPSSVGFSSTAGGSSIGQEIAMSTTSSNSFSASVAVEAKAGAGAGGFKVGVIAGAEAGAGYVMISTNGSSFSGELQNMPIEAQPFGYGMNWRIFCYKYKNGGTSFPVVSYIVSEVRNPPPLPADFTQDMATTTSDAITLTWSYDKTVSGFKIYRYYEFPEGSGSYELTFLPFTKAVKYDSSTGKYYFKYTDTGLSPYTEYKYQIKSVRADNPKESIYSEPMSCRTKTAVGYPSIDISGLDENGQLPIFPDADGVATLTIKDDTIYSGLSYQWQRLVGGAWIDISGRTKAELTISNAGTADNGTYRCRANCIYYDNTAAQNYYISAYSKEFTTVYSKRTPTTSIFTAVETVGTAPDGSTQDGLTANIELYSKNDGHSAAPTGNVTFKVEGTDYEYSKTVALVSSNQTKILGGSSKYFSVSSLTIPTLPVGVYTVTAYYGGSRVFKDMATASGALVVIGNGSAYNMSLAVFGSSSSVTKFDYGTAIVPSLAKIGKNASDSSKIETTPATATKYKLLVSGATSGIDYADAAAFTADSSALNIGSYMLQAYVDDKLASSVSFSIGKRPITIKVESLGNVSAGADVVKTPPVITGVGLTPRELAALNLSYIALNSAGNRTSLTEITDPGNYTVTACTSNNTPTDLYNNYSANYTSGIYTIIGTTYELKAIAADYSGRPVGTVGISSFSSDTAYLTAKTTVLLYATPKTGYEVDKWTALYANNKDISQTGGTTFTFATEAQPVKVTVTFKPANIILGIAADPLAGGTVVCTSDKTFSSGAHVSYNAEYSFLATPKTGYHFSKWQTVSGGITTTPSGTAQPDGSNVLKTLTVGESSMTVYARFVRDSYTLALSGDITAYYMYDNNGTPAKKTITSGSSVLGDTKVIVVPKTGYQAVAGKFFKVNGEDTKDTASHEFTITKNTTISLDTVGNTYAVTTSAENGTVFATINGTAASDATLAYVAGGSALGFTAHASRGYVFDHWTVNGNSITGSSETLTIAELGDKTDVVAVFTKNTKYTANASVSVASRGTMNYTLYDTYGELVGTANTAMPTDLAVYKGETLVLSVIANSGSMVEQWKVNNANTYTTLKSNTINDIGSDINAVAYLKAANNYSVNYVAMGTSGSTVTATADGNAFDSGALKYGGSDLVFSATPTSDKMIDHWTVTSGELTETESATAAVDSFGKTVITPTYALNFLIQNITVRAHFTDLETHDVTVPATTTMGTSAIAYVTPIQPTDNGTRNVTTDKVRTGGTVIMTFAPKEGCDTSITKIKSVLTTKDNNVDVTVLKNVYTATVSDQKTAINLAESDLYYTAYPISVMSGVTSSVNSAQKGETVTLTVTPAANYQLSKLTLSNGTLKEAVSASKLIYTFEMPESKVDVKVEFAYVAPTQGGGGGSAPSESTTVPVSGGGKAVDISVKVAGGIATLDMDSSTLSDFKGVLTLDLSSLENVTGASIPEAAFTSIAGANGVDGLTVSMPDSKLTFDAAALAAIRAAGSGDVTLTAAMVDTSKLSDEQKALIGDRPVIDLTLTKGDKTVSDFKTGTIEVSVPYTIKPGEDPNTIVVWYLNDAGVLETISGKYNAATKSVVFTTSHFSKYVIGYLPFADVSRDEWYFDSVSFAYANGLFSGANDKTFDPDTSMTRAMLVTVLWRMTGKPSIESGCKFSDVVTGEWYAQAVAWAAENNIVSGYGNGSFGTNDDITREQMAVILMNYAKYKKYDVSVTTNLNSFTDVNDISIWAKSSVQWANAEGLISGTGSNILNPRGDAARCQVAAILQRFTENIID